MWKDLTMSQRADMMDLYLSKGITSLDDMRSLYDSSISDTAQETLFSAGGSIHIDPSKKGTFTAAAKKHGMGVQEFASRVLANKENYSPAMVKKANFARNASKWHGYGGNLYDGTTEDTQQMDIPYAGELPDVTVMPRRIANKSWDKVQERWVGDIPTYYAVNPETGKEEMLREIGNGKYSTYDDKHVFDVLGAEAAKKEREQWIKNGGNASDFDKVMLGTLGLGLAPIALPEVVAGVGTALANPYVDAGLTSYFGAHGLNHAINEGIDGWGDAAMTALEVAPLGRLAKPVYEELVQPGMRLFNSPLTGNWTKIGNREYRLSPNNLGANGSPIESRATPSWVEKLPLDESRYYRQVRPDALDSYRANGVISQFNKYGINPTRYEVPMFTKGKPSLYRGETKKYGDVWVVSKPEANLEWESVKGAAVSPKYNGEFNSAPVSEFEFYQYDPAKGYIKLDEGLNLPNGINFSRTPHIDYLKGLSEQQQIEYLTQNGLNDQWLWALKNNPDHLESALSKAPIPNTPQITAENAASIAPEQWTAAQDAAIARGDMTEAQRLRDLHFVTKAPNTVIKNVDGMPAHVYHGTPNKGWNSYAKSKFGTATDNGMYGEGLYATSDRSYADVYARGNNADGKYIGEIKDLYVNGEHPFYVFNKKDLSPREIVNREDAAYQFGRTLKVQDDIPTPIWDEMNNSDIVIETKGTKRPNFAEIVVPRGEQIKSADAVTYDDKGVRIPLGERDNFNINDIRYGLLPFGIGLTGYGLYNSGK